jgi:hypothetical protein
MAKLHSQREMATILAALRYWQREGLLSGGREQDIATNEDRLRALSAEEIDALCERINCGDGGAPVIHADRDSGDGWRVDDADQHRKPICPKCGSDNVVADAAARWTTLAPAGWEISAVFDKGHGCDDCGGSDIEFVWIDTPKSPTPTNAHP